MEDEEEGLEDAGLEDAIQAFWKACQAEDWKAAASEFKDMQGLCCGEEGGEEDGEETPEEKKGRPLALLLTAKK